MTDLTHSAFQGLPSKMNTEDLTCFSRVSVNDVNVLAAQVQKSSPHTRSCLIE